MVERWESNPRGLPRNHLSFHSSSCHTLMDGCYAPATPLPTLIHSFKDTTPLQKTLAKGTAPKTKLMKESALGE